MIGRSRKFYLVSLLLSLLATASAVESRVEDAIASPPRNPGLQAGYEQMYNLRFDAAHQTFRTYEREHPNDALGPVSNAAAYLFSEFNRLGVLQSQFLTDNQKVLDSRPPKEDPGAASDFEASLKRTDTLVAATLSKSPDDPSALLAKTLRLGLHADFLALIQKRELAALQEIKQGRETAQRLLSLHPQYQDANIAMGVENYLLSLKPAPVRWILRATGSRTDREVGVEELRKTAANGEFLAPYAKVLLAVAALRRGDQQEARDLLTWLAEHYPGNALYKNELAKLH